MDPLVLDVVDEDYINVSYPGEKKYTNSTNKILSEGESTRTPPKPKA
jgi:hypothetical protein